MDWRDEGFILSARPHGESAAIVEVFTSARGRHLGVVRGGGSRRMAALLQPGTQVQAHWQARLDEHIGAFVLEPLGSRAAMLGDRLALAMLNAVCAILHLALAERDPHPVLWRGTADLLDRLAAGGAFNRAYLRWELGLLDELGFGLDLAACAVTGSREDLAYVSPKSGRAVSRAGAGGWAARLLPLPPALLGEGPLSGADLARGLALTGHFLDRGLQPVLGDRGLPEARSRLIHLVERLP